MGDDFSNIVMFKKMIKKINELAGLQTYIFMLLSPNSLNKINANVVHCETLSGEGSISQIDNSYARSFENKAPGQSGRVPGKSNYSQIHQRIPSEYRIAFVLEMPILTFNRLQRIKAQPVIEEACLY